MATDLGKMCNIVEVQFLQNIEHHGYRANIVLGFRFGSTASGYCNSSSLSYHKLCIVYEMVFERR
jgi:hypothetical protein